MSTGRKIISLLLLTLILVNTLSTALVIGTFYANRTYFAENFCINKTKPNLCCEGSCHLTKVLQSMPDQQNEPVSLKLSQLSFEFLSPTLVAFIINFNFVKALHTTSHFSFYTSFETSLNSPPPRV